MRVDFSKAIDKILENDESALFLTGDLGYNAFENLRSKYGRRFLNAGVAEQNMVGAAAGFALSGFRPWVYSIVPFVALRALEHIRNDVCFHNLPVRIVGNGGGYTYGIMGSTHHGLEDIAALKALPNMTLYFPCANDQVEAAVNQIARLSGPSYLRLAVSAYAASLKPLDENPVTLTRRYRIGSALTIVGVGHAVHIALGALERQGNLSLDADIFGLSKFPFDFENDGALVDSVKKTGRVLAVEEHYAAGGMGESLKAALPGTRSFEIMAARYSKNQRYGSPRFHLEQCGLTPAEILKRYGARS